MTRYDEALPRFVVLIQDVIGAPALADHVFLRDAAGRLTLVMLTPLTDSTIAEIRSRAAELAPWVDQDTPVASPDALFDPSLSDPSEGFPEYISTAEFTGFVRLIERRVVGQDWMRPPVEPIPGVPPIVVFASHKGGVGRSTALAVTAAALSRMNYNVLVVDLDLEAPGLGSILLTDAPQFGTLDYFVESGLQDIDDEFFTHMVATSALAENGLIHVAPAVGSTSDASPGNVVGKISRAYVERLDADGHTVSFLDRTRSLVTSLCSRSRYDAVFIDARAGLNEATAAAVLGLGAEVLLFGVNTPQTFAGYRYFLGHLARFRPSASGDEDWRYRLRMVQAKARGGSQGQADFRTSAFEIFSDTLYDIEEGVEEDAFNFDYDDVTAPHYAWPILDDSTYAEFNPLDQVEQLAHHLYDRTFGIFVEALTNKIGLAK